LRGIARAQCNPTWLAARTKAAWTKDRRGRGLCRQRTWRGSRVEFRRESIAPLQLDVAFRDDLV
jgi:hypothetical protein